MATFSYTSNTPKISTVTLSNQILLDMGYTQTQIDLVASIDIKFATPDTEIYHLDIDNRCYSSSPKHLVFLSTLGSLESYTFIKRSKEDVSIKGEEIEQQFGYFDESSNFTFALGGVTDYVKLIENKQTLQSDWIDESEYLWLCQELLTSPLVYLYQDGNLLPVKVTESGYDVKTNYNDTVFNLTVKIHVDNDTSTVV